MQKTGLLLLLVLRLAGGAAIQGTVVEHSSGRPLARALVTVATIGVRGAGGSLSVRANSSGQFVFSGLRAGAYLVSASRTGFAPMRYGQKTWKAAGTPIFLSDEESNFVAELRLRRLGAIAGTVWDENQVGSPGQDVVVYHAIRPPKLVAKAKTDDRGVYRVGGLEPGRYYVRTRAGQSEEEGSGPLPTFFRATASVEEAQSVDVDLDQQAEDVNIQPAFGKLYRIAGTALAPPMTVQMTVELHSDIGLVSGSADPSGHFTFESLSPGIYELTAEAVARSGEKLGAYQKMAVDKDMDGIRLPLTPEPDLYVEFEEKHGGRIDPKSVALRARPKRLEGEGPARRIRGEEDVLPPGPWEFSVVPPPDLYVASIAAVEHSDLTSPAPTNGWKELFLAQRYLRLKVILSTGPAALRGRVVSRDQPAAGAPVFLEPLELESGAGLISMRTARTDLQGRYHFTGLPPGRYLVLSSFDFERPSGKEMQAARAGTVSLKEASETRQDLELFIAP